jgi:hypothetical protein
MIGLVNVAFYFQKHYFGHELSAASPQLVAAVGEACPPSEALSKK